MSMSIAARSHGMLLILIQQALILLQPVQVTRSFFMILVLTVWYAPILVLTEMKSIVPPFQRQLGHFVTGSADGDVALWDARKVNSQITLLKGHTDAIEDVEYDQRSNRLFTAGFDSQVLSWDLDGIREPVSKQFDVIMQLPQTYRLKLAPDNSKLLLTTQYSCLIVIDNFNGHTIVRDMQGSLKLVSKIA